MNIYESYISLETAKLLKEAKFDWETEHYFPFHEGEYLDDNELNMVILRVFGIREQDIKRPTLDVAQRWLREEKNFDIIIGICQHDFGAGNEKAYVYVCEAVDEIGVREYFTDDYYKIYEQALEAAIKECLTVILEGK